MGDGGANGGDTAATAGGCTYCIPGRGQSLHVCVYTVLGIAIHGAILAPVEPRPFPPLPIYEEFLDFGHSFLHVALYLYRFCDA